MPRLKIATNVPQASIPANFLADAATMFQEAIGKPMEYICVYLLPDQQMTFGSPGVPCAQIEVMSIGKLGVEENKVLSKKIFDFIKEKLKIEGNRAYINFHDAAPQDVGFNGTTFHEIFAKR